MRASFRSMGIRRLGTTLVELMVTLAVLAAMSAIVGLAFRTPLTDTPTSATSTIAAARGQAITSARLIPFALRGVSGTRHLTAMPDGRVLAERADSVDQLTGRVTHAP